MLTGFLLVSVLGRSQNPVNWTEKQLMDPSELASVIAAKKETPVVISVGPGATIPGSVNVGMINTNEGLEKLMMQLKNIKKDKKIVIYCGCCPFEHCPNVRPAVTAMKEIGFTNYYLLNLPHNIKKDWIDKGYPVAKP
ncbi:MAG: rhodanese-like domain-containing protein [Chitinophagaceae bacterium]|nr:MAG: rhodanese-like domain-containing protein [Chitinophagaceae bacterium]